MWQLGLTDVPTVFVLQLDIFYSSFEPNFLLLNALKALICAKGLFKNDVTHILARKLSMSRFQGIILMLQYLFHPSSISVTSFLYDPFGC